MKNRASNRSSGARSAFGLIAWLEQTKIVLPLKGVECAFNVYGDVVSVEIDQTLFNKQLAASGLSLQFSTAHRSRRLPLRNARQRQASCAPKSKNANARANWPPKKKPPVSAPRLSRWSAIIYFTLSLGNVQPNDLIIIRFAYFQTLATASVIGTRSVSHSAPVSDTFLAHLCSARLAAAALATTPPRSPKPPHLAAAHRQIASRRGVPFRRRKRRTSTRRSSRPFFPHASRSGPDPERSFSRQPRR